MPNDALDVAWLDFRNSLRAVLLYRPDIGEYYFWPEIATNQLARIAVAIGTLIGIVGGTRYGMLDGKQVVEQLRGRGDASRKWRDPFPIRFFLGIAPLLLVFTLGISYQVGFVGKQFITDPIMGSVALLSWLLAVESAARGRVFTKFELETGLRIKVKPSRTAMEYKTGQRNGQVV